MSDFNSSLPIRTQNNGDAVVFIADSTTPSQLNSVDTHGSLSAIIKDASGNAVTSQSNGAQRALDVGINVAGVQIDPRSIRALTGADVVTANQGSAGTAAAGWFTKITDGTNTAAVKAASTAASATDPALVVAFSPNSPLPAGTNTIGNTNIQASGTPLTATGSALNVNISSGTLSTGVVDKTAFTYGTSLFNSSGGVYQDTSPTLTAGQEGIVRLTANRAFHTNLRTSGGVEITAQANGSQEALDVGINVAGVQIDPRQIRALTSSDVVTAAQGTAAAITGAWPVKITDGTNTATILSTGEQKVAITQPLPAGTNVIGSVNQGTSPWITSDLADGSVAGGTAGTKSLLAGLIYNTTAPILTNGQQASLQGDSSGNLKVNLVTPLPAGTNTIGNTNIQASGTALTATGSALNVNISSGSIDTGVADKSAFTYGTSIFQPIGGVFQDTAPTLTAGTTGAARLTTNRALHVNLRDSSGNEKLGQQTSAASIPVVIASDQSHFPIELQDGAGNAITSQVNGAQRALDVGIDVAGVQIDPRAIRALTAADVVTANQGTPNTAANGWPTKITDGTNTAAVKAASTAALATDPALVVALSPNSPLPAGTSNIGKVSIQDSSGNAFTPTNPLFVSLADAPGTSIDNYNTVAAVAVGATSNHDYTVSTGKTLYLKQLWASSSGKLKIEVQVETGVATGVFNSIYVGFNSTAETNILLPIGSGAKPVAAGVRVRIIRTNKDILAQDVYSTISGTEQ